ncbi:MAG: ATP-binding cassette domain-containing protein, partial [Limnohabitans sp.]
MSANAVVLQARGLSKRYGQHLALQGVDLDLRAGQVHVLFGENGAGKSTLINMLAGAREPSAGEIRMGDFQGVFTSVAQARAQGVRVVFQEFSLVPMLTVAENIALGEEPVHASGLLAKQQAREQARRLIDTLGFDLQPDTRVAELPRGKQQMVEICKALRHEPKVLILDEPTSALGVR